jgi:transcriptional regulator with XRE-family HTH domain
MLKRGQRVEATDALDAGGDGRAPAATRELMASLGELLREARSGRYTIEELARRSGVSSGRISQIERGLANPSFETLWRLVTALEVPLGSFFQGPELQPRMLVRKDGRKRLELPQDDLVYELLTPDLQGSLEVFIVRVPPGFDNSKRPLTHRGEKFIHLLEGDELVVTVAGLESQLGAGDSITFDATRPHFVTNRSSSKAVALAAVTPPAF